MNSDIPLVKTMIYKIICKFPLVTDCYVGRTKDINTRINQHKICCNNEKSNAHNYKLYKTIRSNGGFDNWSVEIIEILEHQANDLTIPKERELFWFNNLNATLNNNVPNQCHTVSCKKWREKNKEYIANASAEYQQKNKEILNEKARLYYQKNKEKMNQNASKWIENNRDKNRIYQRQRYHQIKAKKLLENNDTII